MKNNYCNLTINDLNITEHNGKKGVWLRKAYMGIPWFCTLDRINEKTLKLIEGGYFLQVEEPRNRV